MPRTKLLELDPGPTWDALVEELGNPLTAEPLMTSAPSFERTGDDWLPFFMDSDFDVPERRDDEPATEASS